MNDLIDPSIFNQFLELDEDPSDRSFSKELVSKYFEQAKDTFQKMTILIQEENYDQLSYLGHFLKGSSAQLGLKKVQEACRLLQEMEKSQKSCMNALNEAMAAFQETEIFLNKFLNIT